MYEKVKKLIPYKVVFGITSSLFGISIGSDASMAPMWLVLVTIIVAFLGLMMVYKKKKP